MTSCEIIAAASCNVRTGLTANDKCLHVNTLQESPSLAASRGLRIAGLAGTVS
jgi:hypothetical protein